MTANAGVNLVNSLSGLLILTSLLVIEVKQARWSAIMYSLQSMVLVLIFLALAYSMRAEQLYLWAASAFVTKVVLVPWILYRAMSRVSESEMPRNAVGPAVSFILAAVAVAAIEACDRETGVPPNVKPSSAGTLCNHPISPKTRVKEYPASASAIC